LISNAIQLVSLALLLSGQPIRTLCREAAVTAKLLGEIVVPKWTTIGKLELLGLGPGLRDSPGIPEWPASLVGNAGNPYCKESFTIQERGGVKAMDLFFSGMRDEVVRAADPLATALRCPLSDAEKKELQQDGERLLRQMNRVPPMGLDVELIKNLDGNVADWGVKLEVITFRYVP